VELIVVITILAILGTIAFISLQGYSQDAKNAKVGSDLKTLVSAIEATITKGQVDLTNLVTPSSPVLVLTSSSYTYGYRTSTWAEASGALSTATFLWGNVAFDKLGQDGTDFKDPEGKSYLFAVLASPTGEASYQLAGQTKDSAGNYTAAVVGNYVKKFGANAEGLIKGSTIYDTWVVDATNLGTSATDLY